MTALGNKLCLMLDSLGRPVDYQFLSPTAQHCCFCLNGCLQCPTCSTLPPSTPIRAILGPSQKPAVLK